MKGKKPIICKQTNDNVTGQCKIQPKESSLRTQEMNDTGTVARNTTKN